MTLCLASTEKGGFVFDPFLGSGTTAVVSKKLGRRYVGLEQNTEYCCWAQKRLSIANIEPSIQGYADNVFWERNSLADQKTEVSKSPMLVPSANGIASEPSVTKILKSRGRPRIVRQDSSESSPSLF